MLYTREQETRETYTSNQITFQYRRTTDVRQVPFNEGTLLEDVPNVIFKKWAALLDLDNNWHKLGDVVQLSRKQIRELRKTTNPGEELLDILCNKEEVTVRELIYYLDSAELNHVAEKIKESIGVNLIGQASTTTTTTTTTQTQTSLSDSISSNSSQEQLVFRNEQDDTSSCSGGSPVPVDQVKKLNINKNDSLTSISDNEVPGAATGEGCGNKTLINNLNRSEYKFEMVKEVHIHVGGDQEKTQVVQEDKSERNDSISDLQRGQSSHENPLSSPENGSNETASGSQPVQTVESEGTVGERASLQHQSMSGLILSSSITDQDHGQQSMEESVVARRRIFVHPTSTVEECVGKNLEQECAALEIDFRNQPNLDSYRNLRASIPDTEISDNYRGVRHVNSQESLEERVQSPYRIQQAESTISRQENFEKNLDQELQALRRDTNNKNE